VKKRKKYQRSMAVGVATLLTLSNVSMGLTSVHAESDGDTSNFEEPKAVPQQKIDLGQHFDDNDKVRVIVELEGDPAIVLPTKQGKRYKDLPASQKEQLQSAVQGEQNEFLSDAKIEDIDFDVENKVTTVMNGISGEVKYGEIEELEKLPNVESVSLVNQYQRPTEKPQMISSKDLVETIQTWNAGFDGRGMVVGVIDTGIDYTHKDMKLTSNSPKLTKESVDAVVAKEGLKGKFYTNKVPYGYNYADKNSEVRDLGPDASMHGMHVAGTVGANGDESGDGIKGVAPEAQLLALKVFGNDPAMPSTFGDIYIKAIDDAIKLGADVLNMSLGSTAGFVDSNNSEQKAIDRAVNSGVVMSISAGNSANFGSGVDNPYAENPDIGLVGSPGLSTNSISVASLENSKITLKQLTMKFGDESIPIAYKTQDSPDFVEVFGKTNDLDVVYVGDGSAAQYEGKNVKGKVVFAVRSAAAPNYGQIQQQAEAAGASGVIVRGNPAHGDYVSMALLSPKIPLVSLSQSDGNLLQGKIIAAGGTAKVNFPDKPMQVANTAAGRMSTFSSWGLTPDLGIKPEITAPGGQIYSTFNNNKYGVMSGTSMAAPHVAGGSALVLQRVQQLFPTLTGAEKVKRAKLLLMNTAKPVTDPDNNNIYYSPRRQGAGLMQLHSAVSTPIYVVNKGTNEGKVELKEINNDSFTMTLTATNFSKQDVTYNVDASVLTDAIANGYNQLKEQVISNAKVTVATPKITLLAGESADITVKVDLTNAKAALEALMENGYFVEGFIKLTNDSQENPFPAISVPFVGFKGDWNKAPVLDGMIYDADSFYGYAGMVDEYGEYLGFNKFKGYDKNLITISPNGDGLNEAITPVLSFLRNSKSVEYSIVNQAGTTLRKITTDGEQRKNYLVASAGAASLYSYKKITQWDGLINNKKTADGLYYYQVKTQVDLAGETPQIVKIPVRVDTTAPTVSNAAYSSNTGYLSFTASDTASGSGLQLVEIYVDGKKLGEVNPTGKTNFKVKIGKVNEGSTIEVVAYDYGYNTGGQSLTGKWDNTIPYIITDSPEALGYYDTREVPLSGYVSDGSAVEYLKVKGDKIEGGEIDLDLEYNSTLKEYEFATQIPFTEDGVHEIYFEGEDSVGNHIEFRRQIIVDTEGPTVDVTGVPENNYVAADGQDPEVTVTVADNFDELRLQVNGSEEFKTVFDEPFERRALTKEQKVTLHLEPGENNFEFTATDLTGHVVTKTICIYKGEAAPAAFVTNFSASPSQDVSANRPYEFTAEASTSIKWNAKVVDPNGKEFALEGAEGKTYKSSFTPDALAQNGSYTLVLTSEDGTLSKSQTFTVVNFPITVNSVSTIDGAGNKTSAFNSSDTVSVKGNLKNLGQNAVSPTVFVQVKDAEGAVVYFKQVDLNTLKKGSMNRFGVDLALDGFEKGSYKVEVFVWDQNNSPLTESNSQQTFTVN